MSGHVMDTSAILCVLDQEDRADRVLEVLDSARGRSPDASTTVFVPFMSLMEIEYWLQRRLPLREAERIALLVENWPVSVEESTPEWRREAARVKAAYSLSVTDAWIASLAILRDATLVHKDPEFDQVAGLKVERLPSKPRAG